MVTLEQARNLAQDKLSQHIIDEFRKDPLLDLMIFDDVVNPQGGQSLFYTYNRVTTFPTADFRAIGSEYTPHEAETTPITVQLKVLGGSFEIDRVIAKHYYGLVNHVTFQIQQKIEATKALFRDTFINGDTGTNALSFDGLEKALTGTDTEITPDAVIDLSTPENIKNNKEALIFWLDQMLSELNGQPSALLVSRKGYAAIKTAATILTQFTSTKDNLGRSILHYGDIPIIPMGDKPGTTDPIIGTDAEGTTSFYAVRIAQDGVHAVSPAGQLPIETYLPNFTLPGAVKTGEVEMVTAIALKATKAAGVLRGVKIQ